MISSISMPFIRQESGSNEPCVQKDALPEVGSAAWLAGSLVYSSGTGASAVLNPVVTAGTLVYGQSPDGSKTGNSLYPPQALFGLNHFPFDLRDRILEMNIASSTATQTTIGTANGVTFAGGGTNGVALAPGQQYGLYRPTTGTYNQYQFLDVNNTTNKLFEIVALAPNQSVTDNNPRVWVRLITTALQG